MTGKKYTIYTLIFAGFMMSTVAFLNFVVDPCFHYRESNEKLTYILDNQRYINDGISKYFTYNAIITGTSMTEKFKSTEVDEIFNVNSIKTPFSGATYKEINEFLERAISYNNDVILIIRGLDTYNVLNEKDKMKYDSYPDYIYDDNKLNDINYLLDKFILKKTVFNVIAPTFKGAQSTTFDDYSNWHTDSVYGKDAILNNFERKEKSTDVLELTLEDIETINTNISQNVTQLAIENPNIEFYMFYTPYSILYFDNLNQMGTIEMQIDALEYATSLILEVDNIKLFSFFDNYDIITNFDNYRDYTHYSEDINTIILEKMNEDEGLLTKSNYKEHFNILRDFYLNYDYEAIYD